MPILFTVADFAKHMHIGRQEDAHEFLRLLIEAMQKSCINGFDKWVVSQVGSASVGSTSVDAQSEWVVSKISAVSVDLTSE